MLLGVKLCCLPFCTFVMDVYFLKDTFFAIESVRFDLDYKCDYVMKPTRKINIGFC